MPSMPTIGSRIRDRRNERGMTQTALAKAIRVTRNAVSMWENNTSKPSSDHLRQLAVNLDVGFDWLATGRGSQSMVVRGLPLHGAVAAGVWREVGESQDMAVRRVPVAPDPAWPVEAQYALRVEGNSVSRTAKDGAAVQCVDILEGGVEVRDDDLVVVERRRGSLVETTLKRVRRGKRGLELWPDSDDPEHQDKIQVGARGVEVTIKALVIHVVTPVPRGR